MLAGVDEGQDGAPEGGTKPDKPGDVEHRRWDETGEEGGPWHAGDASHLGCVHPKAREQARREDGPPAASAQQLRRTAQWLLGMQWSRDLHQPVPAEEGRDLTTQRGPDDDGDQREADHQHRVDPPAGNRDAADRKHKIARGERQRDSELLDEQQATDCEDQRHSAKVLDEGHALQARRISLAREALGSDGAYSEVTINRGGRR